MGHFWDKKTGPDSSGPAAMKLRLALLTLGNHFIPNYRKTIIPYFTPACPALVSPRSIAPQNKPATCLTHSSGGSSAVNRCA